MPYRGAQSSARRRVNDRVAAVETGTPLAHDTVGPPELAPTARAGLTTLVQTAAPAKGMVVGSEAYGKRIAVGPRGPRPIRVELEKLLPTRVLARKLAKAVAYIEHEDLQERHFGLKAASLILKLRGDLVPVAAGGSQAPPQNLAVLVQVLNEIRGSEPPQVVETTGALIDADATAEVSARKDSGSGSHER